MRKSLKFSAFFRLTTSRASEYAKCVVGAGNHAILPSFAYIFILTRD